MSDTDSNDCRFMTELQFIQECISRMASNSSLMKLIAAGLAVATGLTMNFEPKLVVAAFPLLLVLWGLDAYYLRLEREYRKLYTWVVANRQRGQHDYEFDLNPTRFSADVAPLHRVAASVSVLPFYAAVILGLIAAFAVLMWV